MNLTTEDGETLWGRFDFSHYYKFMTSVGLGLLVISLVVPWFFFQGLDALRIPSAELATLSDSARSTLQERQDILRLAQPFVLWGALAVALLGITAIVYGLTNWRKRQAQVNKSEDLDLVQKERAVLVAATPEEIAQKEAVENSETSENAASEPGAGPTFVVGEGATPPPAEAQGRPNVSRTAQIAAARKSVEERGLELLNVGFGEAFNVARAMRVVRAAGSQYVLDAVLDPPEGSALAQLGVDFKLLTSRSPVSLAVIESAMRLSIATRTFKRGTVLPTPNAGQTEAATSVVLVLVAEDDSLSGADAYSIRVRQLVDEINIVLRRPIGLVLVRRPDFEIMPSEVFRSAIVRVWQDGGFTTFKG